MIREIINFTNGLLSDIPDIMQWNIQPDKLIRQNEMYRFGKTKCDYFV